MFKASPTQGGYRSGSGYAYRVLFVGAPAWSLAYASGSVLRSVVRRVWAATVADSQIWRTGSLVWSARVLQSSYSGVAPSGLSWTNLILTRTLPWGVSMVRISRLTSWRWWRVWTRTPRVVVSSRMTCDS